MSADNIDLGDLQPDLENLYREESYTDQKVAQLRKLVPVKKDGSDDDSRKALFIAQTQIMSQMGALPVTAEVDADNLEDAMKKFPEAIKEAVHRMIEEVKKVQREQASQIVVPEGGAPGMGGPGMGGPAGGGLQF